MQPLVKIVWVLLLASGSALAAPAEKPPLRHDMLGVKNGCFVETVAFLDRWNEANGADAWARLLQWGAREDEEVVMGHAVAICEARGALWCWDSNFGWTRLPIELAQRDNAEVVAVPAWKRYPKISARYPLYRIDFPQSPAASPPTPQLTNSNTSIRDASIVAATLAKKRPANVVQFSYGPMITAAKAPRLYSCFTDAIVFTSRKWAPCRFVSAAMSEISD